MPFPKVDRVKYTKSPLETVICQLRFPAILMIDSEPPSEFQNALRDKFPNFTENLEVQHEFNGEINIAMPEKIVNPVNKINTNKNYEFLSEDNSWKINLTRSFISITTNNYTTWEEFIEKFKEPLNKFIELYKPAYFTRIGLRYVDVFCRSKLELKDVAWKELIQPHFIGILGSPIANNIKEYNNVCEVQCDDGTSIVRIIMNIVRKVDDNEQCFIMDSDIYTTEKVKLGDEIDKLNYMHERSTRLVRFAITDRLHDSMGPVKL